MVRSSILASIAILALSLLASCSSDDAAPTAPSVEKNRLEDIPVEQTLQSLWEASSVARYETIEAVIDPVAGGTLSGVVRSWGRDARFMLDFPPHAIPGTKRVTVTMSIPENSPKSPPVFKFEPDMEFNRPVRVRLYYPSSLPQDHDYSTVFCLIHEDGNGVGGEETFRYTDDMILYHDSPTLPGRPLALEFEVMHFSRWGLQNGKMGP